MKKLIGLLCAALLLCGCAARNTAEPESADAADNAGDAEYVESAATMREVLDRDAGVYTSAYDEDKYICVFERDGALMRAVAQMTPKAYDSLHNKNAGMKAVAGLKVTKVEDLTAGMPTQAELDQLVGRTGGELLDEGWEIVGHTIYNDYESETVFYLVNGLYSYIVQFNEALTVDESFQENEAIRPLTVASVICDGVSDHCIDLDDAE